MNISKLIQGRSLEVEVMEEEDKFHRLKLMVGEETFGRYQKTKVIIFGVGGVGSWCAEALVRSAIGSLTIVDFDTVAASNINRQLPATQKTIGHSKGDVLKERLLEINRDAQITALKTPYNESTSDSFNLEEFDFVIDAIDSLKDKAHLIRKVTSLERPVLFSSMGAALKMDILKIRKSEFWKVKGDALARALRNRFKKENDYPAKKFQCVWSDEILKNKGAAQSSERINGSLAHTTAAFGLALAGMVLEKI
jgi:tRNA A37 threonylcarbamoyladenosine dehydratase